MGEESVMRMHNGILLLLLLLLSRFSRVRLFATPWIAAHQAPLSREGNGTPLQYSCLENPMDGGAW